VSPRPLRITARAGTGAALAALVATASFTPASAAPAARNPAYTVTIKATNLAGKPDTGGSVNLIGVSNTALNCDHQFQGGVATCSVSSGYFMVVGSFGATTSDPVYSPRIVVQPQIHVTGNMTVTLHESAASSEVTMTTPRPSRQLDTDLYLKRTGVSGSPVVMEFYGGPEWISPTTVKPTVGTLQVAVNQHRESPAGTADPYEYTLTYTDPPGTIPPQHYPASAASLATVHEHFYQAVKSRGAWSLNGTPAGRNPFTPKTGFGFIEPDGPALNLPGQFTEYAGGNALTQTEWHAQYAPFPGKLPYLQATHLPLHPGEVSTENWGAYPLHPGVDVLLDSRPYPFGATVPSASRSGNTLRLQVDPFDDNQPGHQIGYFGPTQGAKLSGTYEIDQNGTKVAGGAVQGTPGVGTFGTTAALGTQPSTVRFALNLARTGADFPLSTASSTVWTWHSALVSGGSLPAGWTCVPYKRVKTCAVQPMMTLDYGVTGLSPTGTTPAGQQKVQLTVGHLQVAKASAVRQVTVAVSYDGGKTWHQATVTGQGAHWTAAFSAPAGAKVTLRTSASDTAGGSIAETITSAYQIAS